MFMFFLFFMGLPHISTMLQIYSPLSDARLQFFSGRQDFNNIQLWVKRCIRSSLSCHLAIWSHWRRGGTNSQPQSPTYISLNNGGETNTEPTQTCVSILSAYVLQLCLHPDIVPTFLLFWIFCIIATGVSQQKKNAAPHVALLCSAFNSEQVFNLF